MNRTLFAADCLDFLEDIAALPDALIEFNQRGSPLYGFTGRGAMLSLQSSI